MMRCRNEAGAQDWECFCIAADISCCVAQGTGRVVIATDLQAIQEEGLWTALREDCVVLQDC